MSGPVHEAGETARSLVDVFRSQPFTLALIIMNLALLGLLYYSGISSERERTQALKMLYENRALVGQLLHDCTPDGKH
jgi:glucose-6-phosphate-specific signal transduction histidine kinase